MKSRNIPNFGERKVLEQDVSCPFVEQFLEIKPWAHDENGKCVNSSDESILKKIEDKNIDEEIQSYFEETNLSFLLDRVARSRDVSLLKQLQEVSYEDTYDAPKTLTEAYNVKNRVNDRINNLSKEELVQLKSILGLVDNSPSSSTNSKEVKTNE